MRLEGKVAVVTGAASGIGRSMVRRFVAEGCRVVAADLDEGRLEKIVDEVSQTGGTLHAAVADVSSRDDAERMIDTAVEQWGQLDVLCNNAGVMDDLVPIADVDDERWRKILSINLDGPFYASRRALRHFLERGSGAILNTASAAGIAGGRAGGSYTVSKHGVVGLTRSIAYYYGAHGIRCNALAPGSIMTRMASSMMPHQEGYARYEKHFPTIPEFGKAVDVADVAVFLVSDEARYVNGAIVPVDGGWMSY